MPCEVVKSGSGRVSRYRSLPFRFTRAEGPMVGGVPVRILPRQCRLWPIVAGKQPVRDAPDHEQGEEDESRTPAPQ